jgi:hypothetical protein
MLAASEQLGCAVDTDLEASTCHLYSRKNRFFGRFIEHFTAPSDPTSCLLVRVEYLKDEDV